MFSVIASYLASSGVWETTLAATVLSVCVACLVGGFVRRRSVKTIVNPEPVQEPYYMDERTALELIEVYAAYMR